MNIKGFNCVYKMGGVCFGAAFKPAPMSYADCAGENASSPSTVTPAGKKASALGITKCYYEQDYWAGAVAQCGGVKNMPTLAQLTTLADELYGASVGTTSWLSPDKSVYFRDDNKALLLGVKLNSMNAFHIWTGEETTTPAYAYYRYFEKNYTHQGYYNRKEESYQAVCLSSD